MISFYNTTAKIKHTNTKTNMSDTLFAIKLALAQKLEKMGSSLEEFEEMLNQPGGMEQGTRFVKQADGDGVASGVGNLLNMAMLSSVLVGGTGAYGLHKLKNYLTNQDNEVKDKQQEIARINLLTNKLKAEHGLN